MGIWIFWLAWWLLALIAKRSWLPVLAVYPWGLFALGYLANKLSPWAGTTAMAAVHVVLLMNMARDALRRPSGKNGGPQP
jgi:hypothetical protein